MSLTWLSTWRFTAASKPLLLTSYAAFALACGASAAASNRASPGSAGGANASDAGPDGAALEPVPESLAFDPTSIIKLSPKETRVLTVKSTPAGAFRVRFALIGSGSDGGPGDAALDLAEVQTGDDGIAQVTLTAPSTPTTFSVRASAANAVLTIQTLVGVSVSKLGYTALRVHPSYSGKRTVTAWTATATGGASCSHLVGTPPPDGDLSVTAAPSRPLDIEQVPIGVEIAVTLRAGHYIGGCADVSALSEGDGNQVLVYANDRPLNLAASELQLSFGPSDSRPEVDQLLKAAAVLAQNAVLGTANSDVAALLDQMQLASPAASRDAFSAARLSNDWETKLDSAFGKGAARRVRDPAERWLTTGLSAFNATDTFTGKLGPLGDNALFELEQVARLAPANAGFPSSFQATWSADSSDTLLLGTELTWVPSRLVTALALAPALLEFPEATSVESALARSVDCDLVAKVLLAYGTSPGSVVYASCDEACTASTCTTALASIWKAARDASGSTVASLGVTASGAAQVGDEAEATSLKGSWVGELSVDEDSATASGVLSASSSVAK